MKKFLTLFLAATFALSSCSSSDDDSTSSSNGTTINPPAWIQGTWLQQDIPIEIGFTFKSDDFCNVMSNITSCNKEQLAIFNNPGLYANVSEETTSVYYSIEITIQTSTLLYQFEKISDTMIKGLNTPYTDIVYIKQ